MSFLLIVWPFLIPIGAAFYMFYLCWTRCVGGLKARSVTKYVEHVKQVVKSMKARNGEPVHKRTWDAETMDLPVVKYREQKRPALKANAVSQLIADSEGSPSPWHSTRLTPSP